MSILFHSMNILYFVPLYEHSIYFANLKIIYNQHLDEHALKYLKWILNIENC